MSGNFIIWEDSYSVEFTAIDDQHKALVQMTNELFEACSKGTVAADITFLKTIRKAVEYAKTHFATEEKYMILVKYPKLNEHKKEHENFAVQVLKAVKEFEAGNTAPANMAAFLKSWLLEHIAISDKQYAPYLKQLRQ